jgi:hypothetical protein
MNVRKAYWITAFATAFALVAMATPAHAVPLNFVGDSEATLGTSPGNTVFPTYGGTLVFDSGPQMLFSAVGFPNGVTVDEKVYSGVTTNGITGLLFTYAISNAAGNHGIDSVALSNFTPATAGPNIAADYDGNNPTGGTDFPLLVTWNAPAVDFTTFEPDGEIVSPGSSYLLYIQTHATSLTPGIVSVIDSVPAFDTTHFVGPSMVPEPTSLALCAVGFSCVAGVAAARRKRQASNP